MSATAKSGVKIKIIGTRGKKRCGDSSDVIGSNHSPQMGNEKASIYIRLAFVFSIQLDFG